MKEIFTKKQCLATRELNMDNLIIKVWELVKQYLVNRYDERSFSVVITYSEMGLRKFNSIDQQVRDKIVEMLKENGWSVEVTEYGIEVR